MEVSLELEDLIAFLFSFTSILLKNDNRLQSQGLPCLVLHEFHLVLSQTHSIIERNQKYFTNRPNTELICEGFA